MKKILVVAIITLMITVTIHDSHVFALNQGPNVVRAAIVNGGGATDFCARFLDDEDKPLKEITVSLGAARAMPSHAKTRRQPQASQHAGAGGRLPRRK